MPFIGRYTELDRIAREVNPETSYGKPRQLLHIFAAVGMGKSSFVESLRDKCLSASHPTVWCVPKRNPDIINERALLDASFESNTDALQAACEQFKQSKGHASNWLNALGEAITPNDNGHPTTLIFCLDDYTKLAEEVKVWIRDVLVEPITEAPEHLRIHFLLSTANSLLSGGLLESYWPSIKSSLLEIELGELSEAEAKELLISEGMSAEAAAQVIKEGDLKPAHLIALARGQKGKEVKLEKNQYILDLEELPEEDQRLLVWLAHFGTIDAQALHSLTRSAHKTDEAAARLLQLAHPFRLISGNDKKFSMLPNLADSIISWSKHNCPSLHNSVRTTKRNLDKILRDIPDPRFRDLLAKVAGLKFFNQNLLEHLFPKQAEGFRQIVTRYPKAFNHTEHDNWHLSGKFQKTAQMIAETMPQLACSIELHDKARDYWEKRKEQALEQIQQLEDEKPKIERSRVATQKQLRSINEKLEDVRDGLREQELARLKRKQQAKERSNPPKQPMALPMALFGGGCALLYSGLILVKTNSLLYCLLGIGLMLGSIFRSRRKLESENMTAENSVPLSALSNTTTRLFDVKRMDTISKIQHLGQKARKVSQDIASLQALLEEPYV